MIRRKMHPMGYIFTLATIIVFGQCIEGYVPVALRSQRNNGVMHNSIPGRNHPGFIISTKQQHPFMEHQKKSLLLVLQGKDNDTNEGEGEEDDREGMENAFRSLDGLSSSDLMDDDTPTITPTNTDSEENFSKSMTELEQILKASDLEPAKLESEEEIKMYTDMYNELQDDGEDKMYDDIFQNMKQESSKKMEETTTEEKVLDDADGIGMIEEDDDSIQISTQELSQDSKDFMEKAVKEALAEAKTMGAPVSSSDPNSIFKDEEMMKELNEIFDKANDQLLASIAEMKEEQAALSEKSATKRSERVTDEEQRLAEAERSVSRLVDTVKKETLEVERALADLKEVQGELEDDPLMKAADLKAAGLVKQGALVGTVLFTARALGDLIMIGGVDGSAHATAAAIQGIIALFCAAYFFFF